jgi:tRNA(Leu) C34 or U34 (ribose-2'-O)-methylase TrmL
MSELVSIGLVSPKFGVNVGSAMRAAGCYGADLVLVSGHRVKTKDLCTDANKMHRKIPLLQTSDIFNQIPFNCVPVAVDLIPGAIPLPRYKHPKRALYIFGPEDGTLGYKTISRCRDTVYVPTERCMNLAATVNVILYDRLFKGRSQSHD